MRFAITVEKVKKKKKKDKAFKPARTLILVVLAIVTLSILFAPKTEKEKTVHEKALVLGIFGAPEPIERRHVWISEHTSHLNKEGDIPVHIMFRIGSHSTWLFRGTGTLLGKYPTSILTAGHVFEDDSGQYGWRRIGTNEFTGKEPIFPIISYTPAAAADDSLFCTTDTNRTDFPRIDAYTPTNTFNEWDPHKEYEAKVESRKVWFNTYPEKEIRSLYQIEVKPGTVHLVMNHVVMPGESGTKASFEGEIPGAALVIIRGQAIPRYIYEKLSPQVQASMDWNENKQYGVGNFILVQ